METGPRRKHTSRTSAAPATTASRREFVLRNTRLAQPPLVPEVSLYLGEDVMTLWRKAQDEYGPVDGQPPFWAFAWVGGLAVARYLLDRPELVAGKHVLDFGSGSGLCAIAAMKSGAAHALAADTDSFAREAVELNAEANGVSVDFTKRDLVAGPPPHVDLVVAGDVCYEEPMATRVLAWLRGAHATGIPVLIGDPGRAYLPREGLVPLAEYEIPTPRDLEGVDVKRSRVFAFGQ